MIGISDVPCYVDWKILYRYLTSLMMEYDCTPLNFLNVPLRGTRNDSIAIPKLARISLDAMCSNNNDGIVIPLVISFCYYMHNNDESDCV